MGRNLTERAALAYLRSEDWFHAEERLRARQG
jgi:hypothetical protein